MSTITIRAIEQKDDVALAKVIRKALEDFDANKPGTVYFDPTTDHLHEVFMAKGSKYFVVEEDGVLLGGSGIYPTKNLPADTCELVKLYLSAAARGKGLGKLLMEKCFAAAKELGYKKMYLETMPQLVIAVPLYEKTGFQYLKTPLGNSGHDGCHIWMMKEL